MGGGRTSYSSADKFCLHICNTMLSFNSAKPVISYRGRIFSRTEKLPQLVLSKINITDACLNTLIYHVYRDMNSQDSQCACEHHTPNMIKTGIRLITWILKSMQRQP